MWMSAQGRRAFAEGEGRIGTVTMAGDNLAVRLEQEIREPEIYGPGGYFWTPQPGDRVLVLRGEGESPCVAGVSRGSVPKKVTIAAETVGFEGAVQVNGMPLDEYIRLLVQQMMEGTE